MTVVFDLLADLLVATAAPAKAANPANREHSCGLQADSAPANPVQILANPPPPPDPDSQELATLRNSATTRQSEETRGDSQNSQDSQGVPAAAPVSTCRGCAHLLGHGTCASPVEAGLTDSFVIVWPPEDHAGTCTARTSTNTTKADSRPHQLTKAAADAAHAVALDQGAIARFLAREARLIRLGFDADDAGDLAESAHLRDATGDDRTCCWQCAHLRHWHCRQHQRAGLSASEIGRHLAVLPQRCPAAEVTV
jgi:hypothetical protein